jgi:hypothetical protein
MSKPCADLGSRRSLVATNTQEACSSAVVDPTSSPLSSPTRVGIADAVVICAAQTEVAA